MTQQTGLTGMTPLEGTHVVQVTKMYEDGFEYVIWQDTAHNFFYKMWTPNNPAVPIMPKQSFYLPGDCNKVAQKKIRQMIKTWQRANA